MDTPPRSPINYVNNVSLSAISVWQYNLPPQLDNVQMLISTELLSEYKIEKNQIKKMEGLGEKVVIFIRRGYS